MKQIGTSTLVLLFCLTAVAQTDLPTDKKATRETLSLYHNLKKISKQGYLVGHQDDLAYGVNWKYEAGKSDVKEVTGDYPALYGWELGHLENDSPVNLDSVPFDKMRQYIQQAYGRGGVITISWHGDNPMTGKSAWNPEPGTVASILPGGNKHDVFTKDLDKIAAFLSSLKGNKGEAIPVLFRPFHEHTGGWFWWGNKTTSDEEYKQLFRFTVSYLKGVKGLHNLLYVYNTGTEFSDSTTYLKRYPGDDVVDLFTFDTYQGRNAEDSSYQIATSHHLAVIEQLAKEKNKIAALGETGYGGVPYAKWWTHNLAGALAGHQVAYVLLWRNAGYKPKDDTTEYYVPYKGQVSEADFLQFYHLPQTLFQKDVSYKKMYQ